jgi:hypothetical protein
VLTFYAKGKDARIAAIRDHFVPVVLDGYLRGDSSELAFLKSFQVQGNGFTYVTAGGRLLGHDSYRSLESENTVSRLQKVVSEFNALPESTRKPLIEKSAPSGDSKRIPLTPPPGALIANVFFTYLEQGPQKEWRRALWHVEGQPGTEAGSGHGRNQYVTHVDKLWITKSEWPSLIPKDPRPGMRVALPASLEHRLLRFYSGDLARRTTQDKLRSADLRLTVDKVEHNSVSLKLVGSTKTGCTFEEGRPPSKDARGHDKCGADLRWLGHLRYNRKSKSFDRFEIVATGEAWGGGSHQAATTNYYRGGEHRRWPIGIAFELVTGERPVDRLPPQNANPYRTNGYFASESP